MMQCAVIDASGAVVNVIVASPSDPAPSGCTLVVAPDGCCAGWTWAPVDGFKISAAEQAALDADIAAFEAIAYDVA